MDYDTFVNYVIKNLLVILHNYTKELVVIHKVNNESNTILFIPKHIYEFAEYTIRIDYYYKQYKFKILTEKQVIDEIIYKIQQNRR